MIQMHILTLKITYTTQTFKLIENGNSEEKYYTTLKNLIKGKH